MRAPAGRLVMVYDRSWKDEVSVREAVKLCGPVPYRITKELVSETAHVRPMDFVVMLEDSIS